MRRVLRCDGIVPISLIDHGPRETTPQDLRDIRDWLAAHGETRTELDIVIEGETPSGAGQAGAILEPWATAGATWWLDARWTASDRERAKLVRDRLAAGPPVIS